MAPFYRRCVFPGFVRKVGGQGVHPAYRPRHIALAIIPNSENINFAKHSFTNIVTIGNLSLVAIFHTIAIIATLRNKVSKTELIAISIDALSVQALYARLEVRE